MRRTLCLFNENLINRFRVQGTTTAAKQMRSAPVTCVVHNSRFRFVEARWPLLPPGTLNFDVMAPDICGPSWYANG